jgi:hypothetical protein
VQSLEKSVSTAFKATGTRCSHRPTRLLQRSIGISCWQSVSRLVQTTDTLCFVVCKQDTLLRSMVARHCCNVRSGSHAESECVTCSWIMDKLHLGKPDIGCRGELDECTEVIRMGIHVLLDIVRILLTYRPAAWGYARTTPQRTHHNAHTTTHTPQRTHHNAHTTTHTPQRTHHNASTNEVSHAR